MGIVLVPNQMHLGPFALSLIVIRVEDFNEMFVCKDCSNSEGKNGIRESLGRELAVIAAVPCLVLGSDLLKVRLGLSPRKAFVSIACLISKENSEITVSRDPELEKGQKRSKCPVCPFPKFSPCSGGVGVWWGCPWAQLSCVMQTKGRCKVLGRGSWERLERRYLCSRGRRASSSGPLLWGEGR